MIALNHLRERFAAVLNQTVNNAIFSLSILRKTRAGDLLSEERDDFESLFRWSPSAADP